MILGGGRAQLTLIRTAKEMGIRTIVVGIEGNYPGYKIADEYVPMDIFNKEAVARIAKKAGIDGISMVCSDFGLSTIGYVNDQLGLSGISEYAAEVSSNKLKMKELFVKNGVKTARYKIIHNENDVEEASRELIFPLIVKAIDLQGSRGIYICRDKETLKEKYQLSIQESRQDFCIVEEFIEGEEFGAQAFVYNGKVIFVLPHGDKTLKANNTQVPLIHYVPYKEDNIRLTEEIKELCCQSIRALSIDNCAVNIDLIIRDGVPYIIEVAGRAGANCLPELVSTKLGINYYKMVIKAALGDNPIPYYEEGNNYPGAVMTRMLFSEVSGTIERIEDCSDEIHLFVKVGDSVNKFTNSRDYIGETFCKSQSVEECDKILSDRVLKVNIVMRSE